MDLYCRLFIQSDDSKDKLNDIVTNIIGGKRTSFSTTNDVLETDVRKNEYYDASRSGEEQGFVNAPYTAEIEPTRIPTRVTETVLDPVNEEELKDIGAFLQNLFHLIVELRKHAIVVAVCDYEDLVAEQTGWNWSEKTPIPPST